MLSQKKYNELLAGFAQHVEDEETLQKLATVIQSTMGYTEGQTSYNRKNYEKAKARWEQTGSTSKKDYDRKYYETHRAEINARHALNYLNRKKAKTDLKG